MPLEPQPAYTHFLPNLSPSLHQETGWEPSWQCQVHVVDVLRSERCPCTLHLGMKAICISWYCSTAQGCKQAFSSGVAMPRGREQTVFSAVEAPAGTGTAAVLITKQAPLRVRAVPRSSSKAASQRGIVKVRTGAHSDAPRVRPSSFKGPAAGSI